MDGGSDSDDDDKLQIVEADSGLVDGPDCDGTLPEDEARCSDEGSIFNSIYRYINSIYIKKKMWVLFCKIRNLAPDGK